MEKPDVLHSRGGAPQASQEQQDLQDIALAHRYRLSLTTLPTQSSFRVIAIVYYEGNNATSSVSDLPFPLADYRHDGRHYVVGTNDEPGGFIGGSICAERAALVQLRFLPLAIVSKIVIVTDHDLPISPGLLCREFMAGHNSVPWDVDIVLAGSGRRRDGWNLVKTTLRQLFPQPSPYARLTASQANAFGKSFAAKNKELKLSDKITLPESSVRQLLAAARKASRKDTRMGLHPIQFGAAVMFEDDSIVSSHQKKALEYGASLDAVSQIIPFIERSATRPVALVQVDSYGVIHAPFASARAFLSEQGFGDCRVLVHEHLQDESSNKHDISIIRLGEVDDFAVSDLAPVAPDMGDLWSC